MSSDRHDMTTCNRILWLPCIPTDPLRRFQRVWPWNAAKGQGFFGSTALSGKSSRSALTDVCKTGLYEADHSCHLHRNGTGHIFNGIILDFEPNERLNLLSSTISCYFLMKWNLLIDHKIPWIGQKRLCSLGLTTCTGRDIQTCAWCTLVDVWHVWQINLADCPEALCYPRFFTGGGGGG